MSLLFPLLLRTEPSSAGRASTPRRWSTTLLWLTADTHTLTRTHSTTATLGDAERGTAYRSASADRNHSSSPTFAPSPLRLQNPGSWLVLKEDGRTDGRTEDQRPAVFTLEQQPSALHLPSTISTFPFLHDFCSLFCSFSIILLSVFCFLIFSFRSRCLFLSDSVVTPSPSSLDLVLTLAAKLPVAQCYFFFTHLRTKTFSFCAITFFFLFWN